jgi:hypothetical protein
LDTLRGWWDGVEIRREKIARPVGDGDFPSPGRLGSRLITMTGQIHATTDAGFETAMNALAGLLSDGSMGDLVVTQATGVFTISVGMDEAPQIVPEVYGELARYRMQLWAPDPTITEVP